MKKLLTANIFLRLAFAFIFLYAGVSQLTDPGSWLGFMPSWVKDLGFPVEQGLFLHALGNITLGALFLIGKFKKLVGLAGFLFLIAIVIVNGRGWLLVTFRDIGLALASLAYAFLEKRRK